MVTGWTGRSRGPSSFYKNYIRSPKWEAKRQLWFSRYGKYCRACGKAYGPIHLHHMTYKRLGHELLTDLIALCPDCHKGAEKLYRQMGGRGERFTATQAYIRKKRSRGTGSLP